MNKKIYFNNKFLAFVDEGPQTSQNQSIRFYPDLSEETLTGLFNEILSESDSSLSQTSSEYYTLSGNFEKVFDYLKKNLYYIEAAGGLIKKENDFLFIFRHGRWDLPKGKLEKKETIEHAAIRECEEECSVKKLKIEKQLASTFHIYKFRDKFALKQTYWFFMTTDYDKKLKPQKEEHIEEVKWMNKEEIKKIVFDNSYFTIMDVVNEAMRENLIV